MVIPSTVNEGYVSIYLHGKQPVYYSVKQKPDIPLGKPNLIYIMVYIFDEGDHICDEGESDFKEGGGQNTRFM